MNLLDGTLLLLLGGWTFLDAFFLQLLVSQPLVAGCLAGMVLGNPVLGLVVGFLLQLVWIRDLPMGGRVPAATGPAAVVGVFLASGSLVPSEMPPPGSQAVHLFVALAVALLVGEVGRKILERRIRSRTTWIPRAAASVEREASLWPFPLRGMGESFLTGVLLVAGGLVLGLTLLRVLPLLDVLRTAGDGDVRWIAYPVLGLGLGMVLSLAGRRAGFLWLLGSVTALVLVWFSV